MFNRKKDQRGVAHHFLLPVLAVFLVGAIGGFIAHKSSTTTSLLGVASEATQRWVQKPLSAPTKNDYFIPNEDKLTGRCKNKYEVVHTPWPGCAPSLKMMDNLCKKTFGKSARLLKKEGTIVAYPDEAKFTCVVKEKINNSGKKNGQDRNLVKQGSKKLESSTNTGAKPPKIDPNKMGANGITYGVCIQKGRTWNAKTNYCNRICKTKGKVLSNLSGSQIDYCYTPGQSEPAAATATGWNGISSADCAKKYRQWVGGNCIDACLPNTASVQYTRHVANPYNYCTRSYVTNYNLR